MPELPEVEVSRQGISPYLIDATVSRIIVRHHQLRWPVPDELQMMVGQTIHSVKRRAKYLLLATDVGTAILHLGMSGNLRILDQGHAAGKHDHLDIELTSGKLLRLNDPRRFGAVLWTEQPVAQHKLLANLGPEPLTPDFHAQYLHQCAKGRKIAVKPFLMDNKVVVGVGNIYANESLFRSGINPNRAAGNISLLRYRRLVDEVKDVLAEAIKQGGTTLKDFANADGKPGYFVQELQVYGKAGLPCPLCGEKLKEIKLGQRSTVFCSRCQK